MTVFVDTGVIYAYYDTDAGRHDIARIALDRVYQGTLGQPYVSDYIYDEVVTLTLTRTGEFDKAERVGRLLRGVRDTDPFEMLRVDSQTFDDAVGIFERYHDQALSFTDASTVALCQRRGLETVLSFDDDFDGVIDRTDPSRLVD